MSSSERFYFGTRDALDRGELVGASSEHAWCTPTLDAAIWAAELAEGEGEPRVYRVEPTSQVEDAAGDPEYVRPPYPAMSWRTREPLRVIEEVTEWSHYHGTKGQLGPGDVLEPGHAANFGPTPRTANFVYFARTLDAAVWGAELAAGDGTERVYLVEPTGPYEDDPNLTNVRFRGNPTKSFRSRSPLRVIAEFTDWTGHPPETVQAMKAGLAKLDEAGVEPDDG